MSYDTGFLDLFLLTKATYLAKIMMIKEIIVAIVMFSYMG